MPAALRDCLWRMRYLTCSMDSAVSCLLRRGTPQLHDARQDAIHECMLSGSRDDTTPPSSRPWPPVTTSGRPLPADLVIMLCVCACVSLDVSLCVSLCPWSSRMEGTGRATSSSFSDNVSVADAFALSLRKCPLLQPGHVCQREIQEECVVYLLLGLVLLLLLARTSPGHWE